MRLYHFTNKKYGLQNIALRRIRISRINELNDPFEFLAANGKVPSLRHGFQQVKASLHPNRGIICFSENWQNPLMWSHYADRHKGICLGFDVTDRFASQVTYSAKRLDFCEADLRFASPASEENMNKCILTKFSHWSYEREWRAFIGLDHDTVDESGNYFKNFDATLCLKEIIVGLEADITRSEVAAAIKQSKYESDLTCVKARAAFQTFRVVKQKKEKLWR